MLDGIYLNEWATPCLVTKDKIRMNKHLSNVQRRYVDRTGAKLRCDPDHTVMRLLMMILMMMLMMKTKYFK